MQDNSWVTIWISQLLQQTPMLLIYLIGMAVAVVRWPRHPPVSMLALAALGLLLFTTIVGSALYQWIAMSARDGPGMDVRSMFGVVTILSTCVRAVAVVMLLLAIFGWRVERSVA